MNREILFRGQTRKKGEKVKMDGTPVDGNWVYGGVAQGKGDFSIIYSYEPIEKYVVHSDTLGQFTGLTDKNGARIFEGDIVEFYTNLNIHGGNIIGPEETIKSIWKNVERRENAFVGGYRYVRKDQAIVQWNSKDGLWDLKVYNNGRYKRKSKLFTFRSEGNYEVIGNKWDNPELLEVAHG